MFSGANYGTTRRALIVAAAAVAGAAGIITRLPDALAQPSAISAIDRPDFLRLSKNVTGHADLDRTTAARILAALHQADPKFVDRAIALAALVRDGQEPEALLAAAETVGLRETMLAIVSAWYTGTVGQGQAAEMVSYVDALMYRPVNDGLPVPTYCKGGPLWWTGVPPAAGVTAPKAG